MIFTSKESARPIPNLTIYEYLFENNPNISPQTKSFIDSDDPSQAITFSELKTMVLKVGVGLKRRFPDFKQGDVVAIYSPNTIYYPPTLHGIAAAGGVVATIDNACDVDVAASCLETVPAKIILAHPDTLSRAQKAAQASGISTENILVFGDSANQVFWNHQDLITPVKYTKEELNRIPCFLYFTSGTTRKKKAVVIAMMIGHGELITNLPLNLMRLCHTEMHHVSALASTLSSSIRLGHTAYMLKKFNFHVFFTAVERYQINYISIQPWIITHVVKEKFLTSNYDLSSLKIVVSSGSTSSKELCGTFFKIFNVPILNTFGMTEVVGAFRSSPEISLKGSVGTIVPGFEIKLLDSNGKQLGYNELGELHIKGPTVTNSYYNNSEATLEAFDSDRFLRTQDLVRVSEDGNFTMVDRLSETWKYNDHKVIPHEIETVLKTHPSIVECSVIGVLMKEDNSGVARVFVTLLKDTKDIEQVKREILKISETQLLEHQQIDGGLYVMEKLPKNSAGKIDRQVLRLI